MVNNKTNKIDINNSSSSSSNSSDQRHPRNDLQGVLRTSLKVLRTVKAVGLKEWWLCLAMLGLVVIEQAGGLSPRPAWPRINTFPYNSLTRGKQERS